MNDHDPFSPDHSDDAFDAQLRATIAKAEPTRPMSRRYLQRVWLVVARRVAMVLLFVTTVVVGVVVVDVGEAGYRLKRLVPQGVRDLLEPAPSSPIVHQAMAATRPIEAAPPPPATATATATPTATPTPTTPTPVSLTNEQLLSPLKAVQGDLKACLKAELHSNPAMPREIELAYTVTEEGTAVDVDLGPEALSGRPVKACVRDVVARLRWPPFSGERKLVRVPFKVGRPQ